MRLPRFFAGRELIRERDNALRSLRSVREELRIAEEKLAEIAWRPHLFVEGGTVYARGLAYNEHRTRITLANTEWENAPRSVVDAVYRYDWELRRKREGW